MKSFLNKIFLKYWPILIIFLVEVLLFASNFKKETWLIGWDNLYPELNFKLNIERTFFGVWQEYRSLGYMDGMSHAANLFHDIFRWLLSLFLPTNLIRWVFVLLMHFLGGIGMFLLLQKVVLKEKGNNLIALFGALFYQYNLITVQQFFLPFELFIVHFAFLPFLIKSAFLYFQSGSKKSLLYFSLLSLFSAPQAHVPTIFIVYVMTLALIMLIKILLKEKCAFKRSVVLILATFIVNAYWGLPFAYATMKNSNVIANSKNNEMGTDDIFYRNLKFGDFQSVAQLKGVVLDYWQFDIKSNSSHYMMHPWLEHISSSWFYIPAWLFAVFLVFGLVNILYFRKIYLYPLLGIFIFGFIMMANDTPIISSISVFLREYVPLFHNVFRFTFTKFSILYALGFTIFISLGIQLISELLRKNVLRILFLFCIFVLLSIYTSPSFKGNFFYENLASKMPKDYLEMFSFFNTKDINRRVAILPIPNYWAWTQNNWNTIGSGFMWYGIPQPTTDRAFDPWSAHNENFYWELDQAIFSEDEKKLDSVFRKYDISYILLDSSVYQGASPKFDTQRYVDFLNKSSNMVKIKNLNSIDIYEVKNSSSNKSHISIVKDVIKIGPKYIYDNDDFAFQNLGLYYTDEDPDIYYPFRTLFSGKDKNDIEFDVNDNDDYIAFKKTLSVLKNEFYLAIPRKDLNEFSKYNIQSYEAINYDINFYLNDTEILPEESFSQLSDEVFIKVNKSDKLIFEVRIPKKETLVFSLKDDPVFKTISNNGCYKNPKGISEFIKNDDGFKFTSRTSNNCINIGMPDLTQKVGYLYITKTKNSDIKGLYFNLINNTSRKSDIETYFDHDSLENKYYIIQPPRAKFGLGYTLNINNVSFGKELVENQLKNVQVYQIPYRFLKNISVRKNLDNLIDKSILLPSNATHTIDNRFIVEVDINTVNDNTLIKLSQGFDSDWKAFYINCNKDSLLCRYKKTFPFLFGQELKDHVLVNNWANGWKLDSIANISNQQTDNQELKSIAIVFWPQYLQYLGFLILIFAVIFLLFNAKKRKSLKSV